MYAVSTSVSRQASPNYGYLPLCGVAMVVKDKTLKSFGLKWLIKYRESSPLGTISSENVDRISSLSVSHP